jgi:hypothetical protein
MSVYNVLHFFVTHNKSLMYVEWLCNAMYIMGGSYHDGTWRSYRCVGSNEVNFF